MKVLPDGYYWIKKKTIYGCANKPFECYSFTNGIQSNAEETAAAAAGQCKKICQRGWQYKIHELY